MRIAITGHTAGLGQAFGRYLQARGHDIVGISKRDGNNIRNVPKIVQQIAPCDMWINNAQAGYAQAELLFKVIECWEQDTSKMIWNISTIMTKNAAISNIAGMSDMAVLQYKNQKIALEEAHYALRNRGPKMCLIRPGVVATQPYHQVGIDSVDVNDWTNTLCEFFIRTVEKNLWIEEISLGFSKHRPTF